MLGIKIFAFCAIDVAPEYPVTDEIIYVVTVNGCRTGFSCIIEDVKIVCDTEKGIPGNKK